jgi:hypothetical protein
VSSELARHRLVLYILSGAADNIQCCNTSLSVTNYVDFFRLRPLEGAQSASARLLGLCSSCALGLAALWGCALGVCSTPTSAASEPDYRKEH